MILEKIWIWHLALSFSELQFLTSYLNYMSFTFLVYKTRRNGTLQQIVIGITKSCIDSSLLPSSILSSLYSGWNFFILNGVLFVLVAQTCPTLYNPMDCSLPDSSVQGIFQARILEWVQEPFPPPGDLPSPGIEPASPVSPALAGRFFTLVPPRKPILFLTGIFWCHLPLYSFLSHHEMLKHFTHGLTTFWVSCQSPSKQTEVHKQHPAPKLMDIALPWTSECHNDTALSFTSEVYFSVLNGCVNWMFNYSVP